MNSESISPFIHFGMFHIPGDLNEIRNYTTPHHTDEGLKNIATFAIFDGFNGSATAKKCERHMHAEVLAEFKRLLGSRDPTHPISPDEAELPLTETEITDMFICESFRYSCDKLNKMSCEANGRSGSSALSIFMQLNEDMSVRTLCSNVGDSKAAIYRTEISSFRILKASHEYPPGPRVQLRGYSMSEEHKPTLLRERSRAAGKLDFEDKGWMIRPKTNFVPLPANIVTYANENALSVPPTFELGYPNHQHLEVAKAFLELVHSTVGFPETLEYSTPSDYKRIDSVETLSSLGTDDAEIRARRLHCRVDENDILIGSNGGMSFLTRCIGDNMKPETCVAYPEISACTIEPGEYARIIMASNSVWALLPESVIAEGVNTVKGSTELAQYLGLKVHWGLCGERPDISIIVIDIHRPSEGKAKTPSRHQRTIFNTLLMKNT